MQAKEKFLNSQLLCDITTSTRALSDDPLAFCNPEKQRERELKIVQRPQNHSMRQRKRTLYLKNNILRQKRHGHHHMSAVLLNVVLRIEVSREVARADPHTEVCVFDFKSDRDVEVHSIAHSVHGERRCARDTRGQH